GLPGAQTVGIPLRASISGLDRAALRAEARTHFGLDPEAPVLLVFGGSQGAQSLNAAVAGGLAALRAAGISVLHAHGPQHAAPAGRDRAARRAEARTPFGLDPEAPVPLVFGGPEGAESLNAAVAGGLAALRAAGVSVLHAHGPKNAAPEPAGDGYVPVPYLSRMDLAYAAADLAVCRAGAMTVAEVSAVGLPAVYVPLPHGNGEQALNARPVVDAGGG